MVISDLNLEGVTTLPTKYNPPLIIYTDRVIPLPITSKYFKPVPRWHTQVFKFKSIATTQGPEIYHKIAGTEIKKPK